MADNVLESFFLSLGWKVDEDSQRKFNDSVKTVAKVATGLSATFAGMAVAASAAVAKIAQSFDTLHFVSQRTGASVQSLKSMQYAFSQLGGSSEQATGAIESFGRSMRTNPGLQKFIADLGVATTEGGKARDSVAILIDSVDAIRKRNPHYVGAQYADLLGMDEGTFEMLSRQMDQFRTYQAEYDRISSAIALDNEKAAKAGASFQRSLTELYAILTGVAQKLLIEFAPALERVSRALLAWFEAHPQEIAEFFASVGRAVDSFTKGIEDGALTRHLEAVGNKLIAIGNAVERIISLLAKLGLIGGGGGDSVLGRTFTHLFGSKEDVTAQIERDLEQQQKAERPGLLRRGYNALRRKIGLSTEESSGAGAGAGRSGNSSDAEMTPAGPILDLIAKAEGTTKRGYNDSFNHQVGGTLTDKTLDDIDGIQSGMKGSSAIGRYQFMRKTLKGLRKELGLTGQEKFDGALQDRLAMRLYQRRLAQAKREGNSRGAILKALAQEWASFPTESGQGYYPGQRASISTDQVMSAVEAQRNQVAKSKEANDNSLSPKVSSPPKLPINPGWTADQFNSIFGNAPPMGGSTSTTTTNDHRSVSISNTVHQSGGDGRTDPQRWERAMERYSSGALRDAQTAIR